MDPNGNIYRAPEDEIPAEDKARLEGYFRGRADEVALKEAYAERELLKREREAKLQRESGAQ